ncbi:MAG: ribonuclease P protein component [candidate division Zixibacteria bacterium]|nr:ribonuclease P protein component [candidate division Zixibacteria bacterium]
MVEKNRLPRESSLKSRTEIERLFAKGRRQRGDCVACVWEKANRFKYGVFVPGNFGNAVQRNRFKRFCREAIRRNRHVLQHPIHVGLLPRGNAGEVDFKQINAEIDRIFQGINACR